MGTKIKICGLMRQEDVSYVNNYKPDYIGFVFAKSKRQISKEQAQSLADQLDDTIIRVGVFVDQPVEFVANLVSQGIIHYVQLHGKENNEYIIRLRELVHEKTYKEFKVIKAIQVRTQEDIQKSNSYDCDYVLLDSYSIEQNGGNGKIFDWTMIKSIEKPFFLAGGMRESNVGKAISEVKPYGIDASSSLEIDGHKDEQKIRNFIRTIRRFDSKGGYYE